MRRWICRAAAIAALLSSAPVFAGMLDESDKQQHFAVSAGLGVLAHEMVGDKPYGAAKAFGLAMLPGLAKEVWDSRRAGGSGFSTQDLAADALGAALGIGVGKGVHIVLQRRHDGGKGLAVTFVGQFR